MSGFHSWLVRLNGRLRAIRVPPRNASEVPLEERSLLSPRMPSEGLRAVHTGLAEHSSQAPCGGAGPQIEDRRGWGRSMDAL
jgi:hypothetical protein